MWSNIFSSYFQNNYKYLFCENWLRTQTLFFECIRRGTGRDRNARRLGERPRLYLTVHCCHQNDSALRWAAMSSIVAVSFLVQCTQLQDIPTTVIEKWPIWSILPGTRIKKPTILQFNWYHECVHAICIACDKCVLYVYTFSCMHKNLLTCEDLLGCSRHREQVFSAFDKFTVAFLFV